MYVVTTMNLEGREKLARLLETLVHKHKSRRALARNLGISHTTIIGWENLLLSLAPMRLMTGLNF